MRCPFCSATEDKVVDTRPSEDEQIVRRRRECAGCGKRFTTYERVEELLPSVVKKDARREPFDRAKLLAGVTKACEKRPVPIGALEQMADSIERSLRETSEKEIASSKIDDVAYLRFATVYMHFKDATELLSEVQRLLRWKGQDS